MQLLRTINSAKYCFVGAGAAAPVPEFEAGDMVAQCDFDNTDGLITGCPFIDFAQFGEINFDVASASDSADTGPTADHTGNGGKCHVLIVDIVYDTLLCE